jgi:hypothetical protein
MHIALLRPYDDEDIVEVQIVTQALTSRGIKPTQKPEVDVLDGTCNVLLHTIEYWWNGTPEIDEDIKPCLEEEVESRAEECIKKGCREGELNYEDETHSYNGWWKISKD